MSKSNSPVENKIVGRDKITPRAVAVMAIAAAVYMIAALQRVSPPVVALDIGRSLQIGPDGLGLMFSTTFIAYALMQPLAGFGADRFGPKRCLLLSAALLTLASVWFGRADSLASAASARALVGLAAGFSFVPAVRLAANWLPERHFGMASTLIVAASALSSFLAGSPLAYSAAAFGWRWSFVGLGLISAGLALVVWRAVADRPEDYQPPAGTKAEAAGADAARPGFWSAARAVLSTPVFWLMSLVFCGTDVIYETFTGLWAGPYLMEVHGLSPADAGRMLSVAAIGFLVGGPLLILLGDAIKSYTKVLIGLCLVNVAIAAFLVWGPAGAAPWLLYLLCLAAPIGVHGTALLFAVSRKFFPERIIGSTLGFLNLMPFMFGAAMQGLIGRILAAVQADPAVQALGAHVHYGLAFKPVFHWAILSVAAAVWLHLKARPKFL